MEFPFIFGDLEGWIRVIVVLLFFLSPLLNWLGGKRDKPQQQPRRPVPRPPQPPGQQPRQPQPMGQGRAALENEIEDFLRRAGRGGQQQPAQRPQAPRAKAEPRPQRPPPARPVQQQRRVATRTDRIQRERAPQQPPQLRQTEPPAKTRQPLGEGVGRHVREHIEAHPVSEHSRQLGRGIAQTDERVEDHLHQVFDHSLGQLKKNQVFQEASDGTDASVWVAQQRSNRAAELHQLLRDPQSLRNAIVLTEIFNRPLGFEE